MNKKYIDRLLKLADKVLPETIKRLRSNGEPFLASEVSHLYGFLEAIRPTPNDQ